MNSEEENQFLKSEFSAKIKEYVLLNEQIKRLADLAKERKSRKTTLQKEIKTIMSTNKIDYVNTKSGASIVYSERESLSTVTKKLYEQAIDIYFGENEEEKNKFVEIVNGLRVKQKKSSLRLKKN